MVKWCVAAILVGCVTISASLMSAYAADKEHGSAAVRGTSSDVSTKGTTADATAEGAASKSPTTSIPGFKKTKVVVAVMDGPPWSMKDEDGEWQGITVDLWREIAEYLHLGYEFKEYDLDGVIHAVEHKEVDVSAAGLAITAEREKLFDFSDPYIVFNQSIAVSADQKQDFLRILHSELGNWSLISLCLIFGLITLGGATALWLLEQKNGSEHYQGRHKKAFFKSLFWSISVLVGRDLPKSLGWTTHAPETTGGRLFGIFWMIVGMLLFTLFTASAASVLTSRQLQSIVNTPEDLHRVKVGTVKDSAAEAWLLHHNIKHISFDKPVRLLEELVAHKIDAAVYGGTTLQYYANTPAFINKVNVLRFSLRQDFAAIPVPADSPLRKPISEAILPILESKKWHDIVNKYVPAD